MAFRQRALRSMRSTLRADLKPIMAGDADALERPTRELQQLKLNQQRMKDANAAIRKHAKGGSGDQIVGLVELGDFHSKINAFMRTGGVLRRRV